VFLEGGAKKPPVVSQHMSVAIAKVLEEARGALDVREEEGDRPGRQARHGLYYVGLLDSQQP